MPRRPSIKKKVKPLTDDELGRASLDYTVIFKSTPHISISLILDSQIMGTGERFCGLDSSPIPFLLDGMAKPFLCSSYLQCSVPYKLFSVHHHWGFWVFDPEMSKN